MTSDYSKKLTRDLNILKQFKKQDVKRLAAEKSSHNVKMAERFGRSNATVENMVIFNDINTLMRFRRLTDLERLAAQCKDFDRRMNWADTLMGFFGTAAAVAGILLLPGLGLALSGVCFGAALGKGILGSASIERDCADVPFYELEGRLNKTLGEINRKLDQQTEILKDISDTVKKTLTEVENMRIAMDRGFENILNSIEGQDVNELVSTINKAYKSFTFSESNRGHAPKDQYVNFIEQEIGDNLLFNYVKLGGKLYEALFSIIDKKYAIPKDINHQNAYNALTALSFGTVTYSNIVLSLLNQYTYVAEYYYQERDLFKFNKYLDRLIFYFTTFKHIFTIANNGIVNDVIKIMEEVQDKHNIKNAKKDLYSDIVRKTNDLKSIKQNFQIMSLQIIEETPINEIDIIFNAGGKVSKTNFLDWERGVEVSYALQYEEKGKYSKISKWVTQEVLDIANPQISIRNSNPKNRIVFRKFDNNPPEVVRFISGSQLQFRDLDRDLYDLASKNSYNDNSILQNMNKLLSLGASVSAVFESKRSVIHAAAAAGRVNMLKRILEVDRKIINQKDSLGYTPLHIAVENKRDDFVYELVQQGADVNTKTNEHGVTPLHLAVRFQSEKSVEYLLGSDTIKPNEVEKSGKTALHIAVSDNSLSTEIVQQFINSNKVNVNAKDTLGLTALHIAVLLNSIENAFNLMRKKGCDIYAKDKNNMAPIHYAAMKGYNGMFDGFVYFGVDNINSPGSDKKWTPLHFAAYFKHDDLVDGLVRWKGIKGKISADEPDVDQQTPLHLAAQAGLKRGVTSLMLYGIAKAYKKTAEGYTPLAIAILNKQTEIVKEIVSIEGDWIQMLPDGKYTKDVDERSCELSKEKNFMFDYLVEKGRCDRNKFEKRSLNAEHKSEKFREYSRHFPQKHFTKNRAKLLADPYKLNEDMKVKEFKTHSNVDVTGALLLLDLLIRKFTNEKYVSNWKFVNSPYDATAQALEITEKLNNLLNEKGSENLDSFDVFSKIHKAIHSGNDSKFMNTLCSYINEFASLRPEEVRGILNAVLPNEPQIIFSKNMIDRKLVSSVEHSCFEKTFRI
ncbi:delta-latroinsectotoxin-Lt1a-like [Parasteatoda tepidariorum]|uniref:delta-latroinsectotoxin-Lt1a-like n=1 Tax=Parasteatoda tepidariorum TaxID=114398 RepID=UPI0039BCBDD3